MKILKYVIILAILLATAPGVFAEEYTNYSLNIDDYYAFLNNSINITPQKGFIGDSNGAGGESNIACVFSHSSTDGGTLRYTRSGDVCGDNSYYFATISPNETLDFSTTTSNWTMYMDYLSHGDAVSPSYAFYWMGKAAYPSFTAACAGHPFSSGSDTGGNAYFALTATGNYTFKITYDPVNNQCAFSIYNLISGVFNNKTVAGGTEGSNMAVAIYGGDATSTDYADNVMIVEGNSRPDLVISSNSAPSFDIVQISNSEPIVTNDVIDVQWNVSDAENDTLNVSLTWYSSTDNATWTPHTTDNQSWFDQDNVSYFGTLYHTNASGDLEATDTSAWQYWKAEMWVTDGTDVVYQNSTSILITNNPPAISANFSGTTNSSPANRGDSITFTLEGTDSEDDDVTMKICSGPGEDWSTCTELCEQTTPVSFGTGKTNISCSYATTETARVNYAYGFLYDGGNYSNQINISYFVNQLPLLENFTMQDTTANQNYFFGESIDYFRIDHADVEDPYLPAFITVLDPDSVVKVDTQIMQNISGNTQGYETDLYLDAVGTWSLQVYVNDSDGYVKWYNDTFTVSSLSPSVGGRIYGYDFERLPTYAEVNSSVETYGYYVSEVRINRTINWTNVSLLLQEMKNQSQLAILTFEDDLSDVDASVSYVSAHYADLIDSDHLNAMRHLKFITDAAENSANSAKINNITKRMFQNVSNKIPIFIRTYNDSGIDTNYATTDTYFYINSSTPAEFINTEMNYLRTSSDKSRIYFNLTDALQTKTSTWQTDIMDKMRDTLNTSLGYSEGNVAQLSNGDIIVANNDSTSADFNISTIGITNADAYILTQKKVAGGNTVDWINMTIGAQSAVMIYFTNITKVVIDSTDETFLYGLNERSFQTNDDYAEQSNNAFQFVSSSANPEDARMILTDPSFVPMDFYIWYGTNGAEAINNWTRYGRIILADDANLSWVQKVANQSEFYGYTSVNTYGNNNYPLGCTAGVNCTDWNRSYWVSNQEADIDNWTTTSNVNVFIDGLDIGAVNDVDGLFGDALVDLAEYVRVSKQRSLGLNTYTSYEDYANLGNWTMRESACARWDGTVNSPTYTYEDVALEVTRANFHKKHGLPVLAQVFGNITDYEKSYYCYMQTKVLYGDLAEVSYNQPNFDYTGADDDFQWNYFKYPDIGSELEEDYTEIGNDTYRRRFVNGIVTVNTSSKDVTYTTNDQINNIEFCGYYYDNDDGANDEGYMHFVINDNLSRAFNVVDTDLTAFSKTYKCVNISTDYYEPSGFYELEFYYIDSDASYLNNNGLYIYHDSNPNNDRLSFWDNTLNDHPVDDETDYTYYGTGDNWAFNFSINRVSTESAIDDVSTAITHNQTGTEKVVVTVASSSEWNYEVYDKVRLLNKSVFNGIYVNGTKLNVSEANCNVDSPSYNSTLVDGSTWKACIYNTTNTEYYAKVVIPHLSTQNYTIDGNTPPSVDYTNITLLSLVNGNQSWSVYFNYTDADANNITTCTVNVTGIQAQNSPVNNACNITINVPLNASLQNATLIATDSYGTDSTDGPSYQIASIVYDTVASSSAVGNMTVQYFLKYWNITQPQANYSGINWDYEGLSTRSINLTNGTTREYLNYSTNVIIQGALDFTPDGSNEYVVDQGEETFRYFNITANLSTGEQVPAFNISTDMPHYVSGSQSMTYNCSTFATYSNFTSGSTMNTLIQPVVNGSTQCYQYVYQAAVIYSDASLVSSDSGSTRTYHFNNTLGNDYGAQIGFMFNALNNTSIDLTYVLDYSELTSWSSRLAGSQTVHRYNAPTTFTKETSGVDYTYTDDSGGETVTFNWAATNAPFTSLFTNLSWSVDIGGGGGDGGGGGGGSGSSGGSSASFTSSNTSCQITLDPEIVKFSSNRLGKVTIYNGGSVSFKPSISISGDVADYVTVKNDVNLLPDEGSDLGIEYDSGSEFVEGSATISFSQQGCGEVKVYVQAKALPEALTIIDELFDSAKKPVDFLKDPVVSDKNPDIQAATWWFTVGLVLTLSLLGSFAILYIPIRKSWKEGRFWQFALFLMLMAVIAFIVTIFVVTLVRSFW